MKEEVDEKMNLQVEATFNKSGSDRKGMREQTKYKLP